MNCCGPLGPCLSQALAGLLGRGSSEGARSPARGATAAAAPPPAQQEAEKPKVSLGEAMGIGHGPEAAGLAQDFKAFIEPGLLRISELVAAGWSTGGPAAAAAAAGVHTLPGSRGHSGGAKAMPALAKAFPEGMELRCQQAMCGPPGPVLFEWRSAAKFTGGYRGTRRGRGQVVEVQGVCRAQVKPDGGMEVIELYYNVPGFLKAMLSDSPEEDAAAAEGSAACPVTGLVGKCEGQA